MAEDVSSADRGALEESMEQMARMAKRRSITVDTVVGMWDPGMAKNVDELIVLSLRDLKVHIVEEPAEKLFLYMWNHVDDWPDESSRRLLQIVFCRFFDTMRYMVAYRGKFRGSKITGLTCSRKDAHVELKQRGLTRR